jgi:tRNA1(Val) A37 N6-methylase TrmN6
MTMSSVPRWTKLLFTLPLSLCHLPVIQAAASTTRADAYAKARRIRTLQGHEAAQPLYQQLLTDNTDCSAASYLAASTLTPSRQDQACCHRLDHIQTLRKTILTDYTHANIQRMMNIPASVFCQGPVYLNPVAAGSCERPPHVESTLECLVTLFLLSICLPVDLVQSFLGGKAAVILLQDLGLAFVTDDMVVPHVHLFPLDHYDDTTLILATDLHPRVLSSTTVGTLHHGSVMYIGPDSLALVQHIPRLINNQKRILDLCTGSGIQALAALRCSPDGTTATCVDINPRALQFARFNAALNGLNVITVQGDLMEMTLPDGDYDLILANPPFIPVPSTKDILHRYGLFSSGGEDGEVVLRSIVEMAGSKLIHGGVLAIVSEFMNPQDAAHRIESWWDTATAASGVLLTNEVPVDDETYSTRRADSDSDYDIWLQHLRRAGISKVSPGLLFVYASSSKGGEGRLTLEHHIVPKTERGSIWTPSNADAVAFIGNILPTGRTFQSNR